ncbi:uncharacterized protein LOC110858791 isoform X3 [Folsomia candida]|uniref:uncharacterized protein LOC110858791 isoform X3 n=1 Tax=Folsomia candida TaxID=158441 RepID=UPI001604A9F9|nr:uncharacterized protein LOC110858791 isoform X3 [Folsomia candida]
MSTPPMEGVPSPPGDEVDPSCWANLPLRYGMMRKIENVLALEGDYLATQSSPALRPAWLERPILQFTEEEEAARGDGESERSVDLRLDAYRRNGDRFVELIRNGADLGIVSDVHLISVFMNPGGQMPPPPVMVDQIVHIPPPPRTPQPLGSPPPPNWRDGKDITQMMLFSLEHPNAQPRKNVTFYIGPDQVPISAHKDVLAFVSVVFDWALNESAVICRTGSEDERHIHIAIRDADVDGFKTMLKYIYVRRIPWTPGKDRVAEAKTLLSLGYMFELKDLIRGCTDIIRKTMNFSNAAEILEFATTKKDLLLKTVALNYITANAKKIIPTGDFVENLGLQAISAVLESDELDISEEIIFNATMRWASVQFIRKFGADVKPDPTMLRAELGDALYLIRFPLFDIDQFVRVVPDLLRTIFTAEEEVALFRWFTTPASLTGGITKRTYRKPSTSSSDRREETPPRPGSHAGPGRSCQEPPIKRVKTESQETVLDPPDSDMSYESDVPAPPFSPLHDVTPDPPPIPPIPESTPVSAPTGRPVRGIRPPKRLSPSLLSGKRHSSSSAEVDTTPKNRGKKSATTQPLESSPRDDKDSESNHDSESEDDSNDSSLFTPVIRTTPPSVRAISPPKFTPPLATTRPPSTPGPSSQLITPRATPSSISSSSSTPTRRGRSSREPFLTEEQLEYIEANQDNTNGNNLKNYHQTLMVGLEDFLSQQTIDILMPSDLHVVNVTKVMPLFMPSLTAFRINYLHPAKDLGTFKTFLTNVTLHNSLLFVKKSEEEGDNLSELWINNFEVKIDVNGVTVLSIDHVRQELTISRIDKAAESILTGLKYDENVRGVYLDEVRVNLLDYVPTRALEKLVLREVGGPIANQKKLVSSCKLLKELSIDNMRHSNQETYDISKDFGLFAEDYGHRCLRTIAMSNTKLHSSERLTARIRHSPVEELYMDGCSWTVEFVTAVPFIFHNLKMCKLHKTSNLRLVLQLLEITGLKHLWVWELEFKASCPTQKLPVDYLEDKVDYYIQLSEARMKRILTDAGLGTDPVWLNDEKKTFYLEKHEMVQGPDGSASDTGGLRMYWTGKKYDEAEAAAEFSKLSFDQFKWNTFYTDVHLFEKMNA